MIGRSNQGCGERRTKYGARYCEAWTLNMLALLQSRGLIFCEDKKIY